MLGASGSITGEIHFNHAAINPWLVDNHPDLLTNSALLDLFTESELRSLLLHIETHQVPMYSTLNYRGITFSPTDNSDGTFIKHFEQHMSRTLDRGNPLGAATCSTLERLINEHAGLKMIKADSDWTIPACDSEFIKMNLAFYETGIRQILTDKSQHASLDQWIKTKLMQLENQALVLIVHHRDYLITTC